MDEFTKNLFAERERQDAIYAQRLLIGESLSELGAFEAPIPQGVDTTDWWERRTGTRAALITSLLHRDDDLEREVLTGRTA